MEWPEEVNLIPQKVRLYFFGKDFEYIGSSGELFIGFLCFYLPVVFWKEIFYFSSFQGQLLFKFCHTYLATSEVNILTQFTNSFFVRTSVHHVGFV